MPLSPSNILSEIRFHRGNEAQHQLGVRSQEFLE